MRQRRSFYGHGYEKNYCDDNCTCDKCTEQAALVEKVVCSKDVQKTAEFLLPFSVGPLTDAGALTPEELLGALAAAFGLTGGFVNIRVTPDYTRVEQEVTVIRDKIINLGYIPATLDVEVTPGVIGPRIPIHIHFQEHTDCPGVYPGDQVVESTPVVEAEFNEPLVSIDEGGGTVVNFHLFKAILRTHLTVIRQGIEKNGKFCDLDRNRREPTRLPATINTPFNLTPNTTTVFTPTAVGAALNQPANNTDPEEQ